MAVPGAKHLHHKDFRIALEHEGRLGPHPRDKPRREQKVPQRHHDRRPNVLWLMADQLRGDMLGCLGHPAVKTPNLDRLAARGVCFSRAYCSSPVCMPARASMLTGRYLAEHGVYNNGYPMYDEMVCFPELLQEAGYRCANIGKTHCGRSGQRLFEFNANSPDAFGATMPTDVAFDPTVYPECVFIADEVSEDPNRALYGIYPGGAPTSKSYRLATQAQSFLYWHDDPRPFFLRVSFDDPHPPVVPPPEYAAMYSPDDVPEGLLAAIRSGMDGKCRTVQDKWRYQGHDRVTEEQHRYHVARYMALCTHLDAQIGRVLDSLEEYGFADNTLVFFNADHGHMIGEHGCSHKHVYLYEGVNRIPTIMAWPGKLPEGRICEALVAGEDVAATFLDALGVPAPAMAGVSMLPLARGEVERLHDDVVVQWDDFGFALTEPRWKLIRYDSDDGGELYDLESDPMEIRNLWGDPVQAERRERMLARIAAWRREHAGQVQALR
jgi:arylsulfatase